MTRRLARLSPAVSALLLACTAVDDPECAAPVVTDPSPQVLVVTQGAETLQLSFAATGTEPLSYQWLRGTTILLDNARYSGVTTPELTIRHVTAADAGDYHCVVVNPCGTAVSVAAALQVEPMAPTGEEPPPTGPPSDPGDVEPTDDPQDLASFRACQLLSGPAIPAPLPVRRRTSTRTAMWTRTISPLCSGPSRCGRRPSLPVRSIWSSCWICRSPRARRAACTSSA